MLPKKPLGTATCALHFGTRVYLVQPVLLRLHSQLRHGRDRLEGLLCNPASAECVLQPHPSLVPLPAPALRVNGQHFRAQGGLQLCEIGLLGEHEECECKEARQGDTAIRDEAQQRGAPRKCRLFQARQHDAWRVYKDQCRVVCYLHEHTSVG